jgi:hypothetical protein
MYFGFSLVGTNLFSFLYFGIMSENWQLSDRSPFATRLNLFESTVGSTNLPKGKVKRTDSIEVPIRDFQAPRFLRC